MPEPSGGDLMSAAELKPVLVQSKQKPVSCAVALTKEKQAVVLLDRKMKPRKLMAELKSKAKGAKIELDTTTVRFGRVALQGEDGTAVFTVNKATPAAMQMGLTRKLRPAGVRKVELGVDEKLEEEGEEDEAGTGADGQDGSGHPAAATGQGQGGAADTAAGSPPPARAGAGGDANAPSASQGRTGADAPGPAAADVDGAGDAGPGRGGPQQAPGDDAASSPGRVAAGAPTMAAVTRRLGYLVKRMAPALSGNQPGAAEMRAAAKAGQTAVHEGNAPAATQAADTLERLLGGTASGPEMAADSPDVAEGAGTGTGATPPAARGTDGAVPGTADAAPAGSDGSAPGAAPVSGAEPGAGASSRRGNPELLAKGRAVWDKTRGKVEAEVKALVAKAAGHYGADSPQARTIRDGFEPIIHRFDDRLTAKLDEAGQGAGGDAAGKLAAEVEAIVGEYAAFVNSDPMMALMDSNPIHPVKLRPMLDATLAVLAKAARAGSGGGSGSAAGRKPADPAA